MTTPVKGLNDTGEEKLQCKAVPLQAWSGPEDSRKLRFPDCMTKAHDGGKVVSLMHRPLLPPENTPEKIVNIYINLDEVNTRNKILISLDKF